MDPNNMDPNSISSYGGGSYGGYPGGGDPRGGPNNSVYDDNTHTKDNKKNKRDNPMSLDVICHKKDPSSSPITTQDKMPI